MCGIVAYVGDQSCSPLLIEGLRKLEYRGYDSAGLAVHDGQAIGVVRAVGKLSNLSVALQSKPLEGKVGIGHTRWATHGRPNEVNAHPHVAGDVAVVHNGIIENHVELRRELKAAGVEFRSDTDTEIVAHLIQRERMQDAQVSLADSVRRALRHVRGAYAIAVLVRTEPSQIVVAKQDSPLVVGAADGAAFAASDIPAILAHTRDVLPLEDGELAVLSRGGVQVQKISDGSVVQRAAKRINWSPAQAEKNGYKHFMLKEIDEQPRALEDTLRGRIDRDRGEVVAAEMGVEPEFAKRLGRVYFVACGTSSHAAMAGRYWIEQLARVPSVVEIGSEVRYRNPVFTKDDLVVAVSQSGETLDTLAAIKEAKAQGARVLAVVNVLDSAIPRLADGALYTHAGPEIGVASTKCFTTQLAVLLLLAVYLGQQRGVLPADQAKRVLEALVLAPGQMREMLARGEEIRHLAQRFLNARDMLFLGRGVNFPIALEGALKLKEISYIHAEGYAAGEMKHGPIALIDAEMPVVLISPKDSHYEKTLSNMQEVKARDAQLLAVATEGDDEVAQLCAGPVGTAPAMMTVPVAEPEVLPLLTVVPLQLLAYHIADQRGTDVDQPRNLAKTVTVE